jgi:hypothetical protein
MLAVSIRPAEVVPHRDVVTTVRPAHVDAVPSRAQSVTPEGLKLEVRPAEMAASPHGPLPLATPPPPRDGAEPLDGEVSRLHVTVTRRLLAKLEVAKDALSHAMPGASAGELLEAGLDLLLEKAAKRRGFVEKPRKDPPPSESDGVPAHVKRAVWLRSGGKCEWRLDSGGVCGSTHQLELDHHPIPKAHGGPATIDNIRIHCKAHNLEGARRVFGGAWMDRYARGRGRGVWTSDSSAPSAGVQRAPASRDTTSTTGAERP